MNDISRLKCSKIKLFSLSLFFATAVQSASAETTNFIVDCNADCGPLITKVASLGGTVTNKYENIDAISISIDSDLKAELMAIQPLALAMKDKIVSSPSPKESVNLSESGTINILKGDVLANFLDQDQPEGFEFNNILTGAALLNTLGITGNGSVVAIIDTGTANNETIVPALAGSILGGESFVPDAGEPGATSTANHDHGTMVGTMIAGHAFLGLDSASDFAQSINTHLPDSIIFDFEPGLSVLPLFGSAPDASLYALKVFPATGEGAPESRIIAAMDRAITMKTNYNNGMPVEPTNPGCGAEDDACVYDSLNITVVNMSLGGGTYYPGNDLEDMLTEKMLEVGITLVASAGNEGHAAITGGSPGTGRGSLTVGAANIVGNERILRDVQNGLGIGVLYRPSEHHQTAYFSSRGPSADGRVSTDIVANGFANLMQGATGALSLASGTSFSAPMVAGAAAALVQAFPEASALEIRNALKQSANPYLLGDNSSPIDQGNGFLNVAGAYGLLATNSVNLSLDQGLEHKKLIRNLKHLGIKVKNIKNRGRLTTKNTGVLKPGQVAQYYINSNAKTDQITINFSNFEAALDPADQNAFFGDDLYYVLQDAVTHNEVTLSSGFVFGDDSITIDNPQTGVLRLAVMGDWTNAGNVSADISFSGVKNNQGKKSAKGKVEQGQQIADSFYIPDGTTQVVFELSWLNNWSSYPTDDIDLILLDPGFVANFEGATGSSPERVVIDNPAPGFWTSVVQGYTVHGVNRGPQSKWTMRVKDQDGNVIKAEK